MNTIKDFIYDKSDIFVALLIISIAGFVIFSRVESILEFPKDYSSSNEVITSSIGPPADEGDYVEELPINDSTEGNEIEMYAIYINYGESLQVIADRFVSVGLFESSQDFFEIVESKNAGTNIKTGNFIIPSNATQEEVIEAITKPGL